MYPIDLYMIINIEEIGVFLAFIIFFFLKHTSATEQVNTLKNNQLSKRKLRIS